MSDNMGNLLPLPGQCGREWDFEFHCLVRWFDKIDQLSGLANWLAEFLTSPCLCGHAVKSVCLANMVSRVYNLPLFSH